MSRWHEVTLGDVCEFRYGKSLPSANRTGGDIPVFGSSGVVGYHNVALSSGPTVIVGRKGSIGELYFSPSDAWAIDTAYFIDSTCTDADLRWLFHRLRGLGLTELNKAAAVPGLNREDAYRCRLLLPPLAEQQHIAKVLDHTELLLANRRVALGELRVLSQALFFDQFGDPKTNPKGWPTGQVADYVSSFQGGRSFEAEAGEDVITPYRVLKVSAVTSMTFRPEESKPVPPAYVPHPDHIVRNGDLLFSRANTTNLVGAVALVERTPPRLLLPDKLWRFVWRAPHSVEPRFIWALFQTDAIRSEIARRATGTSGSMKNISQEKLLGVPLIMPPYDIQREFARRVAMVEHLVHSHRCSLSELDALFASIQERAFSCRL